MKHMKHPFFSHSDVVGGGGGSRSPRVACAQDEDEVTQRIKLEKAMLRKKAAIEAAERTQAIERVALKSHEIKEANTENVENVGSAKNSKRVPREREQDETSMAKSMKLAKIAKLNHLSVDFLANQK